MLKVYRGQKRFQGGLSKGVEGSMLRHVPIVQLSLLFILLGGCMSQQSDIRTQSKYFKKGQFQNEHPLKDPKNFWAFFSMRIKTTFSRWPEWIDSQFADAPSERVKSSEIHVTHINHATVLVQTGGYNILTDPIYSMRCSPFSFVGPKRVRSPGIRFEDLPRIDIVLISHDHYDHLDLPTMNRIIERDHPQIYLGLGVASRLDDRTRVREMDWWESVSFSPDVQVSFVPVQHFSGRTPFDRNSTLWGGFVIEVGERKIYFGGDTGYASHFKQTYEKFGSMDLALLPIGAYAPRDFMKYAHVNPEEAIQAHIDLHAKKSVGIHFGTFQLTAEAIDEPVQRLRKELERRKLSKDDFVALEFGKVLQMRD